MATHLFWYQRDVPPICLHALEVPVPSLSQLIAIACFAAMQEINSPHQSRLWHQSILAKIQSLPDQDVLGRLKACAHPPGHSEPEASRTARAFPRQGPLSHKCKGVRGWLAWMRIVND